jgi:predicted regulator of Ras-like GTPase activity (Roadblock/LC7/MglB family)
MVAINFCRPEDANPVEKTMLLMVAIAFLLAPLLQQPLMAQGLDREEAIEAIVGSDVTEEEVPPDVDRIVAAVENAQESAERVRKSFNLDALEIVFLPDLGEGEIEEAVAQNEENIGLLREAIEGSAMFYHAIDSRQILLQNVVAVEFAENDAVTIFVNNGARP